ncbi:MAG TPA: hypothetical protein VGB91_04990 [Rhizomicrobium sp.]
MKRDTKATPAAKRRTSLAGATAVVVGLSATGAVFFSVADTQAAPYGEQHADRGDHRGWKAHGDRYFPRTVQRDLRVSRDDIRRRRGGIEFVSSDYADALSTDRDAVVRALGRKYPWLDADRIMVRGDKIFIGNSGGGPASFPKFENLCLSITLNLCKKS